MKLREDNQEELQWCGLLLSCCMMLVGYCISHETSPYQWADNLSAGTYTVTCSEAADGKTFSLVKSDSGDVLTVGFDRPLPAKFEVKKHVLPYGKFSMYSYVIHDLTGDKPKQFWSLRNG